MKKGFVSIVLIVIIVGGVALLSVGGYFGYEEIKSYQLQKVEKAKQAEDLAKSQQEALEEAQEEIEALKTRQTTQENKPPQVITKEVPAKTSEITAKELSAYLAGVIIVSCSGTQGSGSLWNTQPGKYMVLTNNHVIKNPYPSTGACSIYLESGDNRSYIPLFVSTLEKTSWNDFADIAYMPLYEQEFPPEIESIYLSSNPKRINEFNYKISSLTKCQVKMPIGSPVVVIGFPSSGTKTEEYKQIQVSSRNRIATNGTISGYDDGVIKRLPYSNYFVSVKMDSGNSGGVAISKDEGGLCLLGVPTWLNLGEYETQGIVQNINNVFYQK